MATNKKSFLLYCDLIHVFEELTDEEAGKLIKHTLRYVNGMNPEASDRLTKISFEPIKQQLIRDNEKYDAIVLRNRNNGAKGGRPKEEPKKPIGLFGNPENPNKPDNDTDNDNVNDTVINKREAAKAATQTRISNFKESLYPFTKSKGGTYENEMVKCFFDYWSELNKSGTKMRWELQQTFEISKRLATWEKRDLIQFKAKQNGKEEPTNHIY